MSKPLIQLVDRGRGLQLSTSRITVQDLVPYFQDGCSNDEIMRWFPGLTREEVGVVESYYQAHKDELDMADQRIRERTEERIREQRLRTPAMNGTDEHRKARLRTLLDKRRREKNGERTPG